MNRVAILRCGKLPSFVTWELPNLEELFEEDRLLIRGFQAAGWEPEPVVWNESDVDWDQFDIALIRSTWDYLDERAQFLDVLGRIESSSCRLFNPLAAVRWNMDKHYLFDLETWDVPIIPTVRAADVETGILRDWRDHRPGGTLILKPTIGLGGSHSYRVAFEELDDTLRRLRAERPENEYLIQPFVESILSEGEWSFIYFNSQLSHVLLKKPAANEYRVQGIYGGTVQRADASSADLLQAEQVLAKLPFDILYARLDFVRVEQQLCVIEVELIEPIFSFHLVPESIGRLINASRARLG